MKFNITIIAAQNPKAEIGAIFEIAVARNAAVVVQVVTKVAFIARLDVYAILLFNVSS